MSGQLLITPDGKKLYAISSPAGRSVAVVGVEDLQVKRVVDLPFPPHTAFLSKSGKRIYISAHTPEEGVMVVDTGTDRVLEVIPTGSPAFGIAATPDDQKLFLAMGYAGLKRIDLKTRETRTLSALACPLHMDIDPAGWRLYVSYQHGGPGGWSGHDAVDIYDVDSERSVGTIQGPPMVGQRPTVSPQGDLVLLDGSDACASPAYDHVGCPTVPTHIVHLWHISDRRLMAAMPPQIAGTGAFFPQGSRLLIMSTDLAVWDWARQMISERMSLPGVDLVNVALTPAGDRAFVSSKATGLLVLDAEKEACMPPAHGLANFYSGDGTLDDSQGVASLTSAGPPQFAPGRIGQAFRFNGKDNLLRTTAGGSFCAFCEYEWTESLFAKLDSTAGAMTILEQAPANVARARRLYIAQDNHIILQAGDGLDSKILISSLSPVETGRWYHLAVVTEKHRMSLYIDGDLQGRGSIKQPFFAGEGRPPIFIGASQGKGNFLHGLLDELAVYNRALSADELKSMAGACSGSQ